VANNQAKKPYIDEIDNLSELRKGELIAFGQELYDYYVCVGKLEYRRDYLNKVPINELQFFKRYEVLDYTIGIGINNPRNLRYIPRTNATLVQILIKFNPAKLRKIINALIQLNKNNSESVSVNPVLKKTLKSKVNEYVYELQLINRDQILINGFLISKLRSLDNIETLKCCIKYPKQKIDIATIENETQHRVSRPFHSIISNLGLSSDIRKAFFPEIAKEYIRFVNPVTLPSPLKFKN